jgi:hypothetical protein
LTAHACPAISPIVGDHVLCLLRHSGYVIVAWIWSAIWYVGLDPIKWVMMYALNEDGFRDQPLWRKEAAASAALDRASRQGEQVYSPAGMVAPTATNPLGRASMSKPVAAVLDRQSAAVVPVKRDSTGATSIDTDPHRMMQLARRSAKLSADPAKKEVGGWMGQHKCVMQFERVASGHAFLWRRM